MLKKDPRNQQSSGTTEKIVMAQANQNMHLHDRFKPGRPNLSYADLHHEITKTVKNISPKCSWNHQKQDKKAIEEEELVKYMSHLPSYLERGENRQEKVLNVGVLDWGRLEKWHSQKQVPHRSRRNSLSSSNSSSSFSTEGSSVYSSRDQSCSPARQRMRRPSLQFHLMSSPTDGHPKAMKSFGESIGKFQDARGAQINPVNEREKFIRTDQPFSKDHLEAMLDQGKKKDLDTRANPETGILTNRVNHEVLQCMTVKTKTQGSEFMKRAEKLSGRNAGVVQRDVSQKSETVVLLVPRDFNQGHHSRVPQLTESRIMSGQRAAEASRRSFSEVPNEICLDASSSKVPHSCPLPHELDRCLGIKRCSDAESVNLSCDSSHLAQRPAKVGISPSHGGISEVKKLNITATNLTLRVPSTVSDMKPSKVAAEKVRSTSPFRRISIGMGKISKTFSSKDGPAIATAAFGQDNSSSDAHNGTSRARSSPLRRLLDPLLKPKAPNHRHSGEPLQRYSISTDRDCNSSDMLLDSLTATANAGIVKSDMTSSRMINARDSNHDKKHRSSSFQALLRVAIKNGQPLFTFAVDNEHDILVATMKQLSTSREDDYSCIYTFVAIQEVKKKNGRWINQGGKGKGQDYIPNVVAQLKVSGSQFSNLTRWNCVEQSFAREFVLFAVDLQQAEQEPSDFQPNDELAAIVVKIPKVITRSTIRDAHQNDKCNNLPESRINSTSGENVQNQHTIASQSLISATVILPSGIHSLPSKGGPSSLIQRWRSGGSCDCGGWDLACKLRILSNRIQFSKKSSSSKACSTTDKFEFISQGGEEENQPVFSLAPFKDGIFSVEFGSSLSILQAFSLCIAVLDGKKLCETSASANLFEDNTSLESVLAQNDGINIPIEIDGEVPARYVSYPPLSPVGRV